MNFYISSIELTISNEKCPNLLKLGFMKRTVQAAIEFLFVYNFSLNSEGKLRL